MGWRRSFGDLRPISSYTLGMDNERIREICLALPHAAETLNWGHHLVYWVGDGRSAARCLP